MEEMCANEGKPRCGQTVTKCKTHKEEKKWVRLRIADVHVSFIESKKYNKNCCGEILQMPKLK